eukprot:PhM_4_TR18705/c0_g1_i1/m.7936
MINNPDDANSESHAPSKDRSGSYDGMTMLIRTQAVEEDFVVPSSEHEDGLDIATGSTSVLVPPNGDHDGDDGKSLTTLGSDDDDSTAVAAPRDRIRSSMLSPAICRLAYLRRCNSAPLGTSVLWWSQNEFRHHALLDLDVKDEIRLIHRPLENADRAESDKVGSSYLCTSDGDGLPEQVVSGRVTFALDGNEPSWDNRSGRHSRVSVRSRGSRSPSSSFVSPMPGQLVPTSSRYSILSASDCRRGYRTKGTERSLAQVFQQEWRNALRCLVAVAAYSSVCLLLSFAHSIPALLFAYLPYERDYKGEIRDKPLVDVLPYIILNKFMPALAMPWFVAVISASCLSTHRSYVKYVWCAAIVYSVIVCALFCVDIFYEMSLSDPMYVYAMFLFYTIFAFCVIHRAVKNDTGARWYHMPACCACVITEIIFALVATNVEAEILTWVSPFIFALTSWLTRKAAYETRITVSAASKMSSVSIGMSCVITRVLHCAALGNRGRVAYLELFYSGVNIVGKITLYNRHAIATRLLEGRCDWRARTDDRERAIFSRSIFTEGVFDSSIFILAFVLRLVAEPNLLHPFEWVVTFFLCLLSQYAWQVLTFIFIAYFERVSVDVINVGVHNVRHFSHHLTYYVTTTYAGVLLLLASSIAVLLDYERPSGFMRD